MCSVEAVSVVVGDYLQLSLPTQSAAIFDWFSNVCAAAYRVWHRVGVWCLAL